MPVAVALFTLVLALLAVFQIALILGAPLGRFAWGGSDRVLPDRKRVGSAISVVVYGLFVLVAWDRAAAIDLMPDGVSRISMWVIAAYLVIGSMMNAISRSKAERYTMVPVTLVLAVLALLIAIA